MISKHLPIMKMILPFFVFLSIGLQVTAQSFVRGLVYEDANLNGLKDRKEKGIEGVSVSNGVDVAVSGANGQYQLPIGGDNVVFVIKPSGYKVPTNAATKRIPIIMISNYDTERKAKLAGVDQFICKPFELHHLLDVVEKYIGEAHHKEYV